LKSLEKYKAQAKQEVFRLEHLRLYKVEADLVEFERWRRGQSTAADDPSNDYWQQLQELHDRGVASRRVRVVDFPPTEYLRYEIDFYRGSMSRGEDILFIERAPAIDCMQSTVVTQDFWLFDHTVALLWKYDKSGERRGQDEIAVNQVAPYAALRDCLVERALPMQDFIERYEESFNAADDER